MLEEVKRKKNVLDNNRPLDKRTVKNIREKLYLDLTYNSNAIEGNTLTLNETKAVLKDGITISGKSMREHLEVVNHQEAIKYLEEIIGNNTKISERVIKQIHYLILKTIDTDNAGVYRNRNVTIQGTDYIPPEHYIVPQKMTDFIDWYQEESDELNSIERAAKLHNELVKIHPFIDGNGRTARLLLNLELMSKGYPIVIIEKEDRPEYYDSVEAYSTKGELKEFTELVTKKLNKSLDLYLDILDLNS
ncbi:Fic family protein [Halanaerobacter jeridensis]|uniref:Fic family protein n=1 Tax=Halanaerobacter jeridensis TaxID=706427 RepID=A0A938XUP8_9FIRM|nr:Fic family protein [Halanaerobacter jeridensis]MBM7558136.1 Fic family protein [Halanaerobacter jeridensis]